LDLRRSPLAFLLSTAVLALTAAPALASNGGTAAGTGGTTAQFNPGEVAGVPTPPPDGAAPPAAPAPVAGANMAVIKGRVALAPRSAPLAVKLAIQAANRLRHKPYVWGGGHASFSARGYDCSGAVSYVLHAAGLLSFPEASGALAHWGLEGEGRWLTVYANRGHAYVVIAGQRFDTSGAGQSGPRWRPEPRSASGYHARHPAGL
jgi:cell wall-associated NlpC family hydrolase